MRFIRTVFFYEGRKWARLEQRMHNVSLLRVAVTSSWVAGTVDVGIGEPDGEGPEEVVLEGVDRNKEVTLVVKDTQGRSLWAKAEGPGVLWPEGKSVSVSVVGYGEDDVRVATERPVARTGE